MKIIVSIIVPVYNVGSCLRRCVHSLCEQTYKNIEIILVDDGSTDESGLIADELEKQDSRIKVLHLTNGGVTFARKKGWETSVGLYCLFVDADDFLAPDTVSYFVKILNTGNYDFVSGWYDIIFEDGKVTEVKCPFVLGDYTVAEYVNMSINTLNDFSSIWIGMYRRSVFSKEVFDIDRSFYRGEDATTLIGALNGINRIHVTDKVFYHYFQRSNSVTHTLSIDSEYILKLKELQYQIFNDQYKPLYLPILFQTLLSSYYYVDKHRKKEIKKRIKNLYKPGLLKQLSWKYKLKYFSICNILLAYWFGCLLKIKK